MGNPCIGYGNLTDSSTLSGSGWSLTNPITELKDRRLSRYAQTTGTTAEIIFDHGSAKPAQVFCLFGHNCGSPDTITVTRGTTSGGTDVVNEAPVSVWPFTPLDAVYDGGHFGIFVVLGAESTARYTKIAISSSTSPLRFSRSFVGRLFVPDYSSEINRTDDGWQEPLSQRMRGDGGADSTWQRSENRRAVFEYSLLTRASGSVWHEIQRTHSVAAEVVYVRDRARRGVQQQYGFLGTLEDLNVLQYPSFAHNSAAVALVERGGAP